MPSSSNMSVVRCLARSAAMVALCCLTGCAQPSSHATGAATGAGLVGAWRSNVHFDSGDLAAMKDLQFLYVFNMGGTLTESSNHDDAPPVPPAYGEWRQVAPLQFEARYVFFVTKAPPRFEDIAGGSGWLPAGHGVLTERLALAADRQSFDSTIRYEAFDASGKPTAGSGQGQGHGVRMGF